MSPPEPGAPESGAVATRPSTDGPATGRPRSGQPQTGRQSRTDPRIRARQVAVARDAGRRRLRVVIALVVVVVLAAAVLAVLHSPLLAARNVTVVGDAHTPRAEILAAAGLEHAPPLADVNAAADVAAIERLPWVAHATVVREWPSSVRVVVTERHPVAEVAVSSAGSGSPGGSGSPASSAGSGGPGRYALVDASGRVLADTTTRLTDLATVAGALSPTTSAPTTSAPTTSARTTGVASTKAKATGAASTRPTTSALPAVPGVPAPGGTLPSDERDAVAAAGALPVSLLTQVESVAYVGGSGVVLQIVDGPRVLLGSDAQLRTKMVALATVLTRAPLTGIVTIDLRVPGAPVLTS